jgi:ribosomal-protein-serine acetyltransferase
MNPILLDIPESLETDRLLIRCSRPGDGQHVRAAIAESIDTLRPWLPWADCVPTEEDAEANQRKARCNYLERSDLRLNLYK